MQTQQQRLTAHTALCLFCLLGMVLYTFTYSLVYYGSGRRVVAMAEMWMIFSQLYISVVCGGVQLLVPANAIGQLQCSAFLGIAMAVTCIGTACLNEPSGLHCAAFYPASMMAPIAAAGSVAWVWITYLASLGCCDAETRRFGLETRTALYAGIAMGCVQPSTYAALQTTCKQSKVSGSAELNGLLLFVAAILFEAGHLFTHHHHHNNKHWNMHRLLACVPASLAVLANAIFVQWEPDGHILFRVCMGTLGIMPCLGHLYDAAFASPPQSAATVSAKSKDRSARP
jgi:hypothetical protein